MSLYCSRCLKPIHGMVYNVQSKITLFKYVNDSFLEPYENMSEPTNEFLCENCFNDYADCLNQLNDVCRQNSVSSTEILDGIQFK